jgi:hypothetical protein
MFQNSIKTLIPKLNPKPWLKEVKVFTKTFFLCSKKKKNNKEEDFVDARVDERCLWLALQY